MERPDLRAFRILSAIAFLLQHHAYNPEEP